MPYTYQPRAELKPQGLDGISENQLAQHWKLYEGYVNNTNILNTKLAALAAAGDFGPEYAELKRRLGFEYNGMLLHEVYFGALRKGEKEPEQSSELGKALREAFGSLESFKKEFAAIGKMRGIGWAVLYLDPQHDALSTHWVTLHNDGNPAGFVPLLVLDVWEHAYMVDWGAAGRPDYIAAFLKNVGWKKVEENLLSARRVVRS